MDQNIIMREPVMRLVCEGKALARVWKCNSCGLKLYLAQKTEDPGIRCLCGQKNWCEAAER